VYQTPDKQRLKANKAADSQPWPEWEMWWHSKPLQSKNCVRLCSAFSCNKNNKLAQPQPGRKRSRKFRRQQDRKTMGHHRRGQTHQESTHRGILGRVAHLRRQASHSTGRACRRKDEKQSLEYLPLREKENLEGHDSQTRRRNTPTLIQMTFSLRMVAGNTAEGHPKTITSLDGATHNLTRVPAITIKQAHTSMVTGTTQGESHQGEGAHSTEVEGTRLEDDTLAGILTTEEGEDHLTEVRPEEDRPEADRPGEGPVEYLTPTPMIVIHPEEESADPRHHPFQVDSLDPTPSARKKKWMSVSAEAGTR